MSDSIFFEDLEYIINSPCIDWEKFRNSGVLITGATGLICSTVAKALIYADRKFSLNVRVSCLVRNVSKAREMFSGFSDSGCLSFIEGDVVSPPECSEKFNYIIHGASPTASRFFIEHPATTIRTAVRGTENMLEKAVNDGTGGFVYLSSMEAYGEVSDERVLTEDVLGKIDLANPRSCYPESKRLCEMMTSSYSTEFGLRAMSIRLAQTFGCGVSKDDARVFAMIARCVINKENIVLQTKGTSRHPYLYTAQAAEAILCVLLNGRGGETYNVANPETYCSIYEMAEMAARELAGGQIAVEISESGDNKKFPPPSFLNLDISKVKCLGWSPSGTLKDMYVRMMSEM